MFLSNLDQKDKMVRPPCCDKLNVKRGIWTAEEDAKILAYISKHGAGNWTAVPKKAGLRRCGKSCRLRWTNYLRPDLKHDSFTPQEEEMIIRLHAAIGSRWAIIAQQLPGRTDNDVKNYWNTKLRKKLSDMGIDPVTHKPFSQILVDYGNIGGLSKCGNRIGSLNRDMKNAFMSKSQHLYQPSPPPPGFSNINSHLMMTTTMVSSQAESIIPGGLLNNNNNTSDNMIMNSLGNYSTNSSVDLLAQLQAIKLVTEASNCADNMSAPFYNEGSLLLSSSSSSSLPSSSSSSSTCSTAGQEKSPLNFSWQDFLLDEDALLSTDPQEQNNVVEQSQNVILLPSHINNENNNTTQTNNTFQRTDYGAVPSYEFPATSSGASSFVEAMIDRENEMFLEFPDLLEDPCFYN